MKVDFSVAQDVEYEAFCYWEEDQNLGRLALPVGKAAVWKSLWIFVLGLIKG